jgi:dTDP-4-dehydrorhamnose 3,5-epimerase
LYKCTRLYHKESESGIYWNDPELAIDWGIRDPVISEKDRALPGFNTYKENLSRRIHS